MRKLILGSIIVALSFNASGEDTPTATPTHTHTDTHTHTSTHTPTHTHTHTHTHTQTQTRTITPFPYMRPNNFWGPLFSSPPPEFAVGSVALLLFNGSDTTDSIGTYTWTGTNMAYNNVLGDGVYRTLSGGERGSVYADYSNGLTAKVVLDTTIPTVATIEFYYYMPTANKNAFYPLAASVGGADRFVMNIEGMGVTFRFWTFTVGAYTGFVVPWPLSLDQWHHIVFTFDSVNTKAYVDNVLEHTVVDGYVPTDCKWHIGNWVAGNGSFLGKLDQVRLSSIVQAGFPTED